MDFKPLMELHGQLRSYLYHISEAEYLMIAFVEGVREYISATVPEADYKIYHADINILTIASENVDDLYDILCYAFPDFKTEVEGLAEDNMWYADFSIVQLTEYFGNQMVEFGDDS